MKNRNINHIDHWKTPEYFYNSLNRKYNFNFDPCPLNHDLTLWDGLKIEWKERNFVNPPYSRKLKEAFVKKAIHESKKGKLCVCLLPVSTSTVLFHSYIKPNATDIEFVEKRIKFEGYNTKGEFVDNKCGMHDSMIVVFGGNKKASLMLVE